MDSLELKTALAEINEQQQKILLRITQRAAPAKDNWDKLQCVAPVLSGLLIAGIGAFIGYSYNQQQIKVQEAEAIERFIPHLAGNEKSKKAAILAMSSLTNAELASKMASLFASEGTVSALESMAQNGSKNERTIATEAMARAYKDLAQRSLDENNLAQGENYLKRAITVEQKLHGIMAPELCENLDRLADLYTAQGKYKQAEPLLRRIVAIKETSGFPDREVKERLLRRLADVLSLKGNMAEADHIRNMLRQANNYLAERNTACQSDASKSINSDQVKNNATEEISQRLSEQSKSTSSSEPPDSLAADSPAGDAKGCLTHVLPASQ